MLARNPPLELLDEGSMELLFRSDSGRKKITKRSFTYVKIAAANPGA